MNAILYPDTKKMNDKKTPIQTQLTEATLDIQKQNLIIKESHNVTVNQQEIQDLTSLQLSLQAAIQAIIIAFSEQTNTEINNLQSLLQQLEALQYQVEKIVILSSDTIYINQIQVQIEVAIQAVVELLALIAAKIVEA